MATYPNAIPGPNAATHGALEDEVVAIATELGPNPSGSFSTVLARLDSIIAGSGLTMAEVQQAVYDMILTGSGISKSAYNPTARTFALSAAGGGGGASVPSFDIMAEGASRGVSGNIAPALRSAAAKALAQGGGTVIIPGGNWGLSEKVIFDQNFLAVRGEGKNGVTNIRCNNAGAGLQFGAAGGTRFGLSGGFAIDANDIATKPLTTVRGANWAMFDVQVSDSPGDGVYVEGTQNWRMWESQIQSCERGWALDGAPKNVSWVGGNGNDCRTALIHLRHTVPHYLGGNHTQPEKVTVQHVLNETGVAGAVSMLVNAGKDIYYELGALNTNSAGTLVRADLVNTLDLGSTVGGITFQNTQLSGGQGGTIFDLRTKCTITVLGRTEIQGAGILWDVRHNLARGWLDPSVFGSVPTTKFTTTISGLTYSTVVSGTGVSTLL